MGEYRQSSLRVVAPAALAVFAILVVIVIAISLGGSSDSGSSARLDRQEPSSKVAKRRNYVVKPGDSLGAISEKTGVSVKELQALNPDLDPQALIAGQRVKLR